MNWKPIPDLGHPTRPFRVSALSSNGCRRGHGHAGLDGHPKHLPPVIVAEASSSDIELRQSGSQKL